MNILTKKNVLEAIPCTDLSNQNNPIQTKNTHSNIIHNVNNMIEILDFSEENKQLLLQKVITSDFKFKAPLAYINKIEKNNMHDPLLLQILPSDLELNHHEGYSLDPLGEKHNNPIAGLIHKYQSRVLLTVTSACSIHCRYCFRRHFEYKNNLINEKGWQEIIKYINDNPQINEVILSGGDPLVLNNKNLFQIFDRLESLKHVKTIRLHSRHALMDVTRINDDLINRIQNSRCHFVLVTHANHPNEIGIAEKEAFNKLKLSGVTLLNQSVLLKNINNDVDILIQLSYKLFEAGIMPYYLHLLDKVIGAEHFHVPKNDVINIYKKLLANLAGYLVPKLVSEIHQQPNKTPINII